MEGAKKKRGRPIGWRKEGATGRIKQFASTTISGTPEEIERLRQNASLLQKSVSRYVLDALASPLLT